eukprot:7851580-Pyramimonas_sp.AAC.1
MDDGVDDPAVFPGLSCSAHAARNAELIRLAHDVGRWRQAAGSEGEAEEKQKEKLASQIGPLDQI